MGNNARNVLLTQERLAEILIDAFHIGNANKQITLKGMVKYLENQFMNEDS